jgi:hypothetical protein
MLTASTESICHSNSGISSEEKDKTSELIDFNELSKTLAVAMLTLAGFPLVMSPIERQINVRRILASLPDDNILTFVPQKGLAPI